MKKRSFLWLFLLLGVLGFVGDQWSKYGVFRWLAGNGQSGNHDVIPGWFEFLAQVDPLAPPSEIYLVRLNGPKPPFVNHGALYGIGSNRGDSANLFFMVVSLIAAVAITIWATRRKTREDGLLSACLGLIVSGTLGNLYDRAVFGGVRDFLHFYWFKFPVFNFADCCLVCGAILLLLQAMFLPQPKEEDVKDSSVVPLRPVSPT